MKQKVLGPQKVIKVTVGKVPRAEQEIMARLIKENKHSNRFELMAKFWDEVAKYQESQKKASCNEGEGCKE